MATRRTTSSSERSTLPKVKPRSRSGKNVNSASVSIRLPHAVIATLRSRVQERGLSINANLVAMVERELAI